MLSPNLWKNRKTHNFQFQAVILLEENDEQLNQSLKEFLLIIGTGNLPEVVSWNQSGIKKQLSTMGFLFDKGKFNEIPSTHLENGILRSPML